MAKTNFPSQFYESLPKEFIDCELCGGSDAVEIFRRDRYDMGIRTVLCRHCGFLFTNPRPTREAISKFYQDGYRQFYTGSPEPDSDYNPESSRYRRAQRLVDFLRPDFEKVSPAAPRVMDIGCGSGVLLHVFHHAFPGSRLSGVEPDIGFGKYAESQNQAAILYQDVEQYFLSQPSELFDVVFLNHVLEHLYQPLEKLQLLRQRIRPGGLLLVEVPNILSGEWPDPLKIFHIAHVSHFIPRTLEEALGRAGFEILRKTFEVPRAMTYLCRKLKEERAPGPWLPLPEAEIASLQGSLRLLCLKAGQKALKESSVKRPDWIRFVRQFSKKVKKRISRWRLAKRLTPWIKSKEVVILGRGCSLSGEPPKGVLYFGASSVFQNEESPGKFRVFDLYFSAVRKPAAIDFELSRQGIQTRVLLTSHPVSQRPFTRGRADNPPTLVIQDLDTDDDYLSRLFDTKTARDLRKTFGRQQLSSESRLLAYALCYGARAVYWDVPRMEDETRFRAGCDDTLSPYALDDTFLKKIAVKFYGRVFSLRGTSSLGAYFPHKPFAEKDQPKRDKVVLDAL